MNFGKAYLNSLSVLPLYMALVADMFCLWDATSNPTSGVLWYVVYALYFLSEV